MYGRKFPIFLLKIAQFVDIKFLFKKSVKVRILYVDHLAHFFEI